MDNAKDGRHPGMQSRWLGQRGLNLRRNGHGTVENSDGQSRQKPTKPSYSDYPLWHGAHHPYAGPHILSTLGNEKPARPWAMCG